MPGPRRVLALIIVGALLASAPLLGNVVPASAGSSGSNLWVNPGVETDSNSDGIPDGWSRGGSEPSFAQWTSSTAHGGSRSICVVDTSSSTYGEWYATQSIVTAESAYEVGWWHGYQSSLDLSVQVRFLDGLGNTLGSPSYYATRGNSTGWIESIRTAVAPTGAVSLSIAITSDTAATGSICLDDISVRHISPSDLGGDRNLWSGTSLTADLDSNGRPDGWSIGGTASGAASWESGSPRAVCLNDTSASNYAEWYSSGQAIVQPGLDYELRWERKNDVTAPMFVQVRFLDHEGSLIGSAQYHSFSGTTSGSYVPVLVIAKAPAGAWSIAFSLTSDVSATGTACLRSPSVVRAAMPSTAAGPNLMPNPMVEFDSNSDGVPDGWARGGTAPTDAIWSSTIYSSPGRALCLNDQSATEDSGPQWYMEQSVAVTGGAYYALTWSEWVDSPPSDDDNPQTDLYLQVQYLDASSNVLPGSSIFLTNGDSGGWRKSAKQLEVPSGATQMRIVLGSDRYATGEYCADDFHVSGPIPGSLRHLAEYPSQPSNLSVPDWDSIGEDFASIVFDAGATGEHLPLIDTCEVETVAGYEGPAYSIQSYVGVPQFHNWESVTTFGALYAATLTGNDMSNYGSVDYVSQIETFYSETNGHAVIYNNPTFVDSSATCDDNDVAVAGDNAEWYTLLPTILWGQIIAHYDDPAYAHLETQFLDAVDAWIGAVPDLAAADWDIWSYNFLTDEVNEFADIPNHINGAWASGDYDWVCDAALVDPADEVACKAEIEQHFRNNPINQPDIGIGIAWIALEAYNLTSDPAYLAAAEDVMDDMATRTGTVTSHYESIGYYGPLVAARLNAEHGEALNIDTFLEWIFTDGFEGPRPSWGLASDKWGDFDAYGIPTGNGSSGGYAFMKNTGVAVGAIAPTLRYDSRYAHELGKWLLHVANNAKMFYPAELPTTNQHAWDWADDTGVTSIPYEGVKRYFEGASPYGTSDVRLFGQPAWEDFGIYSGWAGGVFAALFEPTVHPEIVQVDLRATDTLPGDSYPTYLYYNPTADDKTVTLAVGGAAVDLYDTVRHEFFADNVTGNASITVPGDGAVIVVVTPGSGTISVSGGQLLVDSVVVDYQYAQ